LVKDSQASRGCFGPQDLRLEVWITQFNLDGQIEFLDADAVPLYDCG
jgi:hypothetical protein